MRFVTVTSVETRWPGVQNKNIIITTVAFTQTSCQPICHLWPWVSVQLVLPVALCRGFLDRTLRCTVLCEACLQVLQEHKHDLLLDSEFLSLQNVRLRLRTRRWCSFGASYHAAGVAVFALVLISTNKVWQYSVGGMKIRLSSWPMITRLRLQREQYVKVLLEDYGALKCFYTLVLNSSALYVKP